MFYGCAHLSQFKVVHIWHVHFVVCILYFNNKKMEEKGEKAATFAKTWKSVRSREVLNMAFKGESGKR